VGPGAWPLLPRTGGADLLLVEGHRVIRARWRELNLDVVVGELASGEPFKPVAPELDPHHPRRQLNHVDDLDHAGRTATLRTRALGGDGARLLLGYPNTRLGIAVPKWWLRPLTWIGDLW